MNRDHLSDLASRFVGGKSHNICNDRIMLSLDINVCEPATTKNRNAAIYFDKAVMSGSAFPDCAQSYVQILDELFPNNPPTHLYNAKACLEGMAEEHLIAEKTDLSELHSHCDDLAQSSLRAFESSTIVVSAYSFSKYPSKGLDEVYLPIFIGGLLMSLKTSLWLVEFDRVYFCSLSDSPGKLCKSALECGILPIAFHGSWRAGKLYGLPLFP